MINCFIFPIVVAGLFSFYSLKAAGSKCRP
jgi:hypothetical protein